MLSLLWEKGLLYENRGSTSHFGKNNYIMNNHRCKLLLYMLRFFKICLYFACKQHISFIYEMCSTFQSWIRLDVKFCMEVGIGTTFDASLIPVGLIWIITLRKTLKTNFKESRFPKNWKVITF